MYLHFETAKNSTRNIKKLDSSLECNANNDTCNRLSGTKGEQKYVLYSIQETSPCFTYLSSDLTGFEASFCNGTFDGILLFTLEKTNQKRNLGTL